MKLRSVRDTLYASVLLAAAVSTARATDLYWDTNGALAGIGNNGASTWAIDTGKTVWSTNSIGNAAPTFWTNNDDAYFTGTAGSVALAGTLVPRSISVTSNGYQFAGGNLTLSYTSNGNVSQSAPATASSIFVASGITATFKNSFVGSMDLNLVGPGTTLLANPNSFSGNINVAGSILQANDDNALGNPSNILALYDSSTFQTDTSSHSFPQPLALLTSNATAPYTFSGPGISFLGTTSLANATLSINVTPGSNLTLAGVVSGAGLFDKKGTGTVTFSGAAANTFSGGLTIDAGTVQLNKTAGIQALAGPILINANGTLSLLAANQIADSANLTIQTGGTFNMNSNNDIVRSLAGGGALNLGNASLTLLPTADTTFSGSLSGTNALLAKGGAANFTLTGSALGAIGSLADGAGPMILANGSLILTSAGATGFTTLPSSLFVEGGASLTIHQGFTLTTYATPAVHNSGAILVDGPTTSWSNLDAPGVPADIRIGFAGGTSTLTVQNGATIFSQSFLSIGSHIVANTGVGSVLLQSGATLTAQLGLRMDANCTLTIDHAAATVGGLTSLTSSTPSVFLADPGTSTSALTINAATDSTFNGNIADAPSGPGGITMNGNGLVVLGGFNTYTGPTRVHSGELLQSGGSNDSPITVDAGAALSAVDATLSPLNGTGAITVGPGAQADYSQTTVNAASIAGAGFHDFALSTLNNSTIQFGTTAAVTNASVFNNVTLNGLLTSDSGLTWNGAIINSSGQWTVSADSSASSLVSNGLLNIGTVTSAALTVGSPGLILGGGSRTYVGSVGSPGSVLSVPSGTFQLNGALLENNGAVSGNLFVNFGSLAEGAGTYTSVDVTRGGQIFFSASQSLSLTIDGGSATITAGTLKAATYFFASNFNAWSGQLELDGNKFIVEATTTPKSGIITLLENQIAYGKSHNAGITDSISLPPNTTLAVIDNGSLAIPLTSFGGLPVDNNSLLVTLELLGDANIDGHVDLSDLSTILNNFGATTPEWTSGNFDGAPAIDLTDLSDVLNNFGQSTPNAFPQLPTTNFQLPSSPTPEPLTLSLLAPAPAAFLARRRPRKIP